jgi:hypothetical protein
VKRPRWLPIAVIAAAALASIATSKPRCPIATEGEPQPLGCATMAAEIAWKSRGGTVTLQLSATEACRLTLQKIWIDHVGEPAKTEPETIALEAGQTVERVIDVPTSSVVEGRGRDEADLFVETDQGTAQMTLARSNCSGCCS